jgi:hypothetical protein
MSIDLQLPTNDDDFDRMMRAIDTRLREKGLHPRQRPSHALKEISQSLNLELPMSAPLRDPIPGVFIGVEMTIRVHRWYRDNYESKLAMQPALGRAVLLIRDEPWVVSFPRIFGKVQFTLNPSLPRQSGELQHIKQGPLTRNILDFIVDLPDEVRKSLLPSEQEEIGCRYREGMDHMLTFSQVISVGMCRIVAGDLESSVNYLMAKNPDYAQSKWASLQAAEKMLKMFIDTHGGTYEHDHNLQKLAGVAARFGLKQLDPKLVPLIQCSPKIRYGKEKTNLRDAHAAHWSAVSLIGIVASQLI